MVTFVYDDRKYSLKQFRINVRRSLRNQPHVLRIGCISLLDD